jgi:hypothetical protein
MAATAIPVPNSGEVVASSWGAAVAGAHNGIQSGAASMPSAVAGNASLVVVFPRPYAAPPVVAVAGPGSSFFMAQVAGITATQCTLYVRDIRDAQAGTGATVVQWIAVGIPA